MESAGVGESVGEFLSVVEAHPNYAEQSSSGHHPGPSWSPATSLASTETRQAATGRFARGKMTAGHLAQRRPQVVQQSGFSFLNKYCRKRGATPTKGLPAPKAKRIRKVGKGTGGVWNANSISDETRPSEVASVEAGRDSVDVIELDSSDDSNDVAASKQQQPQPSPTQESPFKPPDLNLSRAYKNLMDKIRFTEGPSPQSNAVHRRTILTTTSINNEIDSASTSGKKIAMPPNVTAREAYPAGKKLFVTPNDRVQTNTQKKTGMSAAPYRFPNPPPAVPFHTSQANSAHHKPSFPYQLPPPTPFLEERPPPPIHFSVPPPRLPFDSNGPAPHTNVQFNNPPHNQLFQFHGPPPNLSNSMNFGSSSAPLVANSPAYPSVVLHEGNRGTMAPNTPAFTHFSPAITAENQQSHPVPMTNSAWGHEDGRPHTESHLDKTRVQSDPAKLNKFACLVCKKSTNDEEVFEYHLTTEGHLENVRKQAASNFKKTSQWPFCHICNASFDTEMNLVAHMTSDAHLEKALVNNYNQFTAPPAWPSCFSCNESFNNEKDLFSHMKTPAHVNIEIGKMCRDDKTQFAPSQDPNKTSSNSPLKFYCYRCNRTFKTDYSLQAHMVSIGHKEKGKIGNITQEVSVDSNTAFECSVCSKTFDNEMPYQAHMVSVGHKEKERIGNMNPESRPKFECSVCAKTYNNEKPYLAHMVSVGHKEKERIGNMNQESKASMFECSVCSKTFDNEKIYLAHVQSHNHLARDVDHTRAKDVGYPQSGNLTRSGVETWQQQSRTTAVVQAGIDKSYCQVCNVNFTCSVLEHHNSVMHQVRVNSPLGESCVRDSQFPVTQSPCQSTVPQLQDRSAPQKRKIDEPYLGGEKKNKDSTLVWPCCLLCNVAVDTEENLLEHWLSDSHIEQEAVMYSLEYNDCQDWPKCIVCDSLFFSKKNLLIHMKMETHLDKSMSKMRDYVGVTRQTAVRPQQTWDMRSDVAIREPKKPIPGIRSKSWVTNETNQISERRVEPDSVKLANCKTRKEDLQNLIKRFNCFEENSVFHCYVCETSMINDTKIRQTHLFSDAHLEKRNTRWASDQRYAIQEWPCCVICNLSYKTKKFLFFHLKDIRHIVNQLVSNSSVLGDGKDPPTCFLCDKSFGSVKPLVRHMQTISHRQREMEQMLDDARMNGRLNQLAGESALSTDNSDVILSSCPDCGASFSHKKDFLQHLNSKAHSDLVTTSKIAEQCWFHCFVCENSLPTTRKLEHNISEVHLENKRIQSLKQDTFTLKWPVCLICSISFDTEKYLQLHMKTRKHRDEVWRRFHSIMNNRCRCSVCQEVFFSGEFIKHHITTDTHIEMEMAQMCHDVKVRLKGRIEETLFLCRICDRKFKSLSALQQHETTDSHRANKLTKLCPEFEIENDWMIAESEFLAPAKEKARSKRNKLSQIPSASSNDETKHGHATCTSIEHQESSEYTKQRAKSESRSDKANKRVAIRKREKEQLVCWPCRQTTTNEKIYQEHMQSAAHLAQMEKDGNKNYKQKRRIRRIPQKRQSTSAAEYSKDLDLDLTSENKKAPEILSVISQSETCEDMCNVSATDSTETDNAVSIQSDSIGVEPIEVSLNSESEESVKIKSDDTSKTPAIQSEKSEHIQLAKVVAPSDCTEQTLESPVPINETDRSDNIGFLTIREQSSTDPKDSDNIQTISSKVSANSDNTEPSVPSTGFDEKQPILKPNARLTCAKEGPTQTSSRREESDKKPTKSEESYKKLVHESSKSGSRSMSKEQAHEPISTKDTIGKRAPESAKSQLDKTNKDRASGSSRSSDRRRSKSQERIEFQRKCQYCDDYKICNSFEYYNKHRHLRLIKQSPLFCLACNIRYGTERKWANHLVTDVHLENAKKRQREFEEEDEREEKKFKERMERQLIKKAAEEMDLDAEMGELVTLDAVGIFEEEVELDDLSALEPISDDEDCLLIDNEQMGVTDVENPDREIQVIACSSSDKGEVDLVVGNASEKENAPTDEYIAMEAAVEERLPVQEIASVQESVSVVEESWAVENPSEIENALAYECIAMKAAVEERLPVQESVSVVEESSAVGSPSEKENAPTDECIMEASVERFQILEIASTEEKFPVQEIASVAKSLSVGNPPENENALTDKYIAMEAAVEERLPVQEIASVEKSVSVVDESSAVGNPSEKENAPNDECIAVEAAVEERLPVQEIVSVDKSVSVVDESSAADQSVLTDGELCPTDNLLSQIESCVQQISLLSQMESSAQPFNLFSQIESSVQPIDLFSQMELSLQPTSLRSQMASEKEVNINAEVDEPVPPTICCDTTIQRPPDVRFSSGSENNSPAKGDDDPYKENSPEKTSVFVSSEDNLSPE